MWSKRLEARAVVMRNQAALQPKDEVKFREYRVKQAKAAGVYYPEHCPDCHAVEITRKGFKWGVQRYLCKRCGRKFRVELPKISYVSLMCFRCGLYSTLDKGEVVTGGRRGYCLGCKRHFLQGGREDLEHNWLLLKCRVDSLEMSKQFSEEILQQASLDVLEGKGYCWTVELRVNRARAAVMGEIKEYGSNHPEYKRQTGVSAGIEN